MKKLLLCFLFLGLFLLKTQGVFAQKHNTFSCTWQPETDRCAENLNFNTCQNGFQSSPQVCAGITSDSICYQTVDQPCVSSDLPSSRWKCVGVNCHPCVEGESCPFDNSSTCNQACPVPPLPTATSAAPGSGEGSEGIDFNELRDAIPGLKTEFKPGEASNVGGIISIVLPYLFVIAGLLLLFYLIYGGFQMMIAANNEKGLAEAKGKITNALIGFLLLFISYWLMQILGHIFGIAIF